MSVIAEYDRYDAIGLAALVAAKEVSASELLETAVARVEAVNPRLNAVVHKLYDYGRSAIAAGLPDGPLAGVPFLLKDLGALIRGAPTSSGSRFFDGFVAEIDSTITERYRNAGLVFFGRTATPEFGLTATTETALHGPTRNPWNLDRIAGGSSGGSAAAVAAGIVPAAHATDGGGSIRIPASCCGLFGLKPTRARTPAGPLFGEGWSGLSSGHAVSRSVRDSAALLDAVHGPAPGDPYMAPPVARPFLQEVGADPGRLRVAFMTRVPDGPDTHAECIAAAEAAARLCESLGHHVEPAVAPFESAAYGEALRVIITANLRNTLEQRGRMLGRASRPDDVEPTTWQLAERGRSIPSSAYAAAIQTVHGIGRKMAGFFARYDLLITPTLAEPPLPLGTIDLMHSDGEAWFQRLGAFIPFTPVFNGTGQPAASLPLHWTKDGLPVGVQLVARFGDEATLLRVSSQIETAAPWRDRRPPVIA
jgi:amidase/6-aminohexanoate-cyclic-dimer hydrolase